MLGMVAPSSAILQLSLHWSVVGSVRTWSPLCHDVVIDAWQQSFCLDTSDKAAAMSCSFFRNGYFCPTLSNCRSLWWDFSNTRTVSGSTILRTMAGFASKELRISSTANKFGSGLNNTYLSHLSFRQAIKRYTYGSPSFSQTCPNMSWFNDHSLLS